MKQTRQWLERKREDALKPPTNLSGSLGLSERLALLLWTRAYGSVQELEVFLNPGLRHLVKPDAYPGVSQGAQLIALSLLDNKKMAVWGDYDVDGITSTALVLEILRFHGFDPLWHIPERKSEGYGLNISGLEELAEQGIELLLTVDCGITDTLAVQRAQELGMRVVISDHHLPPEGLPPAEVLCNPKLGPSPCPNLAGVGVAFFLMAKVNNLLAEHLGRKYEIKNCLDLVALGTLADMVPLLGQNRILAKNGMLLIDEAKRPGLAELKLVSGYQAGAKLGSEQIVFSLAPRINAAGRMSHAAGALELLMTKDRRVAAEKADELNRLNNLRRVEEEDISRQALEMAAKKSDNPGLVLAGSDWNQGVIGIVATRVVEACNKPVVMLANDGGMLKGSCRSVPGFDIHNALAACREYLAGYGGHSMAAGLRLPSGNLPGFERAFLDFCSRSGLSEQKGPSPLIVDGRLDFADVSDGFVFLKELEMLQPFGQDNPEPIFSSPVCTVVESKVFGPRKNHLLLVLRDESTGHKLNAKAWRKAGQLPDLQGRRVSIAFSPTLDLYNGIANLDLRIRDLRLEQD